MSAKTCLLCGRPLSRIGIGAGEFCSREHRNQYRLRRGMDRVLEANQVASLMRKRETPKPISAMVAPPDGEPRSLFVSPLNFSESASALAAPPMRWRPLVHPLQPGGPVVGAAHDMRTSRREFGILPATSPRVIPGFHPPRIEPPGSRYLEQMRRPRALSSPPRVGVALRVSLGAGFRLWKVRSKSLKPPALHSAAFMWPDRSLPLRWACLDSLADSSVFLMNFALGRAAYPHAPRNGARPLLRPPSVVGLPPSPPLTNGTQSVRLWGHSWTVREEMAMPAIGTRNAGWNALDFTTFWDRALAGADSPRMTLVHLSPQEGPVSYSPVIALAVDRTPARKRDKIEEHFDNGMANWVGGIEDWKVDAVGVRTGALALFMPSLEMADYDVEFLAKIENRSVTFVFRASGETEYYAATFATAGESSLEFSRNAVIDRTPEPAVVSLVRTKPGSRTFTVRLKAVDHGFTIWLDGQQVDTWTDSRLASGGVGFVGAPQDRARIYRVRLSPAGAPGKEY